MSGRLLDATLIRRDRIDEKPRLGKLGGIRQWIESINDSLKGQLSLEHHGGHIPQGVRARICQRILALAAGVWHSWALWGPANRYPRTSLHQLRPLNP